MSEVSRDFRLRSALRFTDVWGHTADMSGLSSKFSDLGDVVLTDMSAVPSSLALRFSAPSSDQPNPTRPSPPLPPPLSSPPCRCVISCASLAAPAASAWRSAGDAGLAQSGSRSKKKPGENPEERAAGGMPLLGYSRTPFISTPLSSPLRARRRHLAGLLPPLLHRQRCLHRVSVCCCLLPRRRRTHAEVSPPPCPLAPLRAFLDEAKYPY